MSYYKQQEVDFIERTKTIISQYKNIDLPHNKKFEVTLLLNCFVGLVVLPQQHWFKKLSPEIKLNKEWGIDEKDIIYIKDGESKNLKNTVKHLRNSISHYHFKAFHNEKKDISYLIFQDFTDRTKKNRTFEAKISIASLTTFTQKFSDFILSEMKSEINSSES